METRKITPEFEKKIDRDMSMFAQLDENEKSFIMGAIWTMLSQKKGKGLN
ncbi:hypothetical protein [Clostridium butyricum]|nr:hypothetical protein [Clostridium butyricum]